MPIKVVFVCLLAGGHLQIPIALGKSLLFKDPQNEIYFICDEENDKKIKAKCSKFKTLVYDSIFLQMNKEEQKKRLDSWLLENKERFKHYVENFGFRVMEIWKNRVKNIQNLINQVEPDLVIVENLFNLPFIMSMKYKWAHIVSTNPLKISNHVDYPPLASGISKDSIDFQWYVQIYEQYGAKFRQRLDEWYKEFGIERKPSLSHIEPSPYFNVLMFPKMLNYFDPEIDLEGKWLQLNSAVLKDEVNRYIKNQGWESEKVAGKDEFLTDEFLKKPGKTILLSMGTFVSNNAEIFNKFIVPVIAKCPHHFIVSKGSSGSKIDLPNNCIGSNNIQQLELLPLVDAFISHGGNNSFCEGLYFGVPMIIVPMMGDQHDNACRLEELKLGKKIYLQNISTEELCKAIDYVTNNESIKKRLKEMSEIIQKDDSMEKLVDLVIQTCSEK